MLHGAVRVQSLMGPRHRILLACFPKSGSTWLRTIFAELPGFRAHWITSSTGRGEQELAPLKVARAAFGNFVAQHHVRYHDDTHRMIEMFDLRPVVLVRNIFDCVVSLRDHVRDRWPEIPQALVTSDIKSLPDDQLSDFLIDMAVPWFFDFYVSWVNCADTVPLRYEDLRTDPQTTVETIVRELGIPVGPDAIAAAITTAHDKDVLLNVGVSGRGDLLTRCQRDRIVRQARYYPSVDFTAIGLPGN